ncbi:Mth938-like domain-containing protein [Kangiella sp. TOML190]|uniref:Mth938-like domain-containing protein n=1 Tax=Kangiella sp. TOML190 TaxID=2931351 RepID=UPI00203EC6A4|nr:Mth938-like domain-containing protein [Kangiella sp. TOML190]
MEISLDAPSGKYQIQSYESGRIIINQTPYQGCILLSPDQLETLDSIQKVTDISQQQLKEWRLLDHEVVILGTGKTLEFPDWGLLEAAQLIGRPLEVMATDAACRTFTILASEGRKVLALLLI